MVDRRRPIRIAPVIRKQNPALSEFWNVSELVIQAGLHGLPIGHAYLSKLILDGKGPRLFGTCGSNTILVEPEEGRRWIREQVARRTTLKPNNFQRRVGIDDKNFASR